MLLALIALFAAAEAPLEPTLRGRTIRAARRQGPIHIDGKLDEPAWQLAEKADGFTQVEPEEGKPSPLPTSFRVLWDEQALYLGIECEDPEPPVAYPSRRDRQVEGDRVDFDLETTLDGRTAYHFSVYAAGQQVDALHYNDTDMTTDWDAVWESEVARSPRGWSAELRIPLRNLRIPENAVRFGLQVSRIVSRRHEESRWVFVPKDTPGYVSTQFGALTGLEGIRPVRELELRPYLAARIVRTAPAPGDVASPARLDACPSVGITRRGIAAACAGLDLRYGLSSDLSLIATVNPDFGQVEADQRVLNLSTFETFFPEKRPFFLEGLDLFKPPVRPDYGGNYGGDAFQLFYSRRIGRSLDSPDLPDGAQQLYLPTARPVAEAMKLFGSIGPATVGLLSALETPVSAQIRGAGGAVNDERVASAVHSAAGRARFPVGDSGLFGVTATAVDPISSGRSPLIGELPPHAHTAGADLVLFDGKRNWNLQSQIAGSLRSGGDEELQRDGTLLRDGSKGAAGTVKVSKEGGDVLFLAEADYLSPQFNTNDLGFMRRANLTRLASYVNLRDVHPSARWQSARIGCGGRHIRNAAFDVPLYTEFGCEGNVTLNSFWYYGGGAYGGPHGYDDRELGDGTPFERPATGFVYGFIGSDSRRDLFAELDLTWTRGLNRFYDSINPSAQIRVRPMPQLETQLDLSLTVTRGDIRALDSRPLQTEEGRLYLFAPQDSRSLSATLRGTYAFSPKLTLQAYAQLFTAGVTYRSPLRYLASDDKRRVHFDDLSPARDADFAPRPDGRSLRTDEQQAGLNVNLILRWEWALGSTLYLVYAHATDVDVAGSRGFEFRRELSVIADPSGTHGDTLLVKVDFLKAL